MSIKLNFNKICSEVPKEIIIVPATKTQSVEKIIQVIDAGAKNIGENYVQEAKKKKIEINKKNKEIKWHLIGRLQKDNINRALKIFDVIQSVDSLELAKEINKRVPHSNKELQKVFIQINIGREEQKSGFLPDIHILKRVCNEIRKMKNLELGGLMTIEPFTENELQRDNYFREMKNIFDELSLLEGINIEYLSMGMSGSYKQAIKHGSNMIRPGRIIFGER